MATPYSIQFDDDEGQLLAVALELFIGESRVTLGNLSSPDAQEQVLAQIKAAEALLFRINRART